MLRPRPTTSPPSLRSRCSEVASGLDLPGGLITLLNDLGYVWPDADEVRLVQVGQAWIDLQNALAPHLVAANAAAAGVWAANSGADIEAFRLAWRADGAGADTLAKDMSGVVVVGALIIACAAVVLTLKAWVIAQLVLLAAAVVDAVATAPLTFGASLLEIPVFKEIADRIINALIGKALQALLG
jgi:hypothetical protein